MKSPLRFLLLLVVLCSLQQVYAQPYKAALWTAYNTQTVTLPFAGSSQSPYVSSATHNVSGLTPFDDSRCRWFTNNTSTTLNTATAPYQSYRITTSTALTFDRFVLGGLASTTSLRHQLRWSVDNYATSLGEFKVSTGTNYTLTSVNLAAKGSIASGTIEFRIYYFNATGSDLIINPGGYGYASVDGTPASYSDNTCNATIWYSAPTPVAVCSGTPVAGTASVSPVSGNISTYSSASLSLVGYTTGATGIGLQWQSSANAGGPFNDISGATAATYTTPMATVAGSTYYRAKVTCSGSGQIAYSNVSTVTASAMAAPGNAFNLDGTNDYVNCGNSSIVSPSNIRTMECWVRFNSFGDQEIVNRSSISYGVEMLIYGGNLSFFCMRDGSNTSYISYPASNLQTNRWYHLAATWNNTKESMRLYVNGTAVGTRTDIGNVNTGIADNSAVNLRIGQWNDASARYLSGSIDEVRVWNTTRTQSEIQANMYNVVSPFTTGLSAYYRFDQGTASGTNTGNNIAYDLTSNALHGTITNMALTGATSNWVESYAMVIPAATAATASTGSTLTANWTAPAVGVVERYLLDVSTSSSFATFVGSYNGYDVGTGTSFVVSGLAPSTTYYYRVRAQKASVTGQGVNSNTITASTTAFALPGNAIHFSGTNKAVVGPTSPLFNLATATVECWVKRDALNGQNTYLAGVRNDPNGSRFSVHQNDNSLGIWNGSAYSSVTMPAAFVAGKWYHIAAVIKAASTDLYVNGTFIGATTNGMGTITGLPLLIGASSTTSTGEVLNGAIDEVRIWSTQRSVAQIQDNRFDTVPAASAGLVAYYKFDQGAPSGTNTGATVVTDASLNGLNANLVGFGLTGSTSNWIESYAMAVPAASTATPINTASTTVNWTAPLRGTVEKYLLDVSTNANFTTFVTGFNGKDVGLSTTAVVTGLTANTTYYFRVRSEKASVTQQGGFSNTGSFTTCAANLTPVVTVSSNPAGSITVGTPVTFTAMPVNGGATPTYRWFLNGVVIPSAISNTYVTNSLANGDVIEAELTSNASCITVAVVKSSPVTVTVNNAAYTWNGGNGNWNTATNWTPAGVPSGCTADVSITSGTPTITAPVSVANLSIAAGAELVLSADLSLCGNLSGSNGTASVISGNGSLILNGTNTQVLSGNTTISNILLSNSNGAAIANGATVNLTGVFTPVSGTFNTNGALTLKSTANGIATVAAGTGNYISGNVTVERYFPAKRAWRFVTSPVSDAGTVFQNWQNNGNMTPATGVEIWRPTGGNGFVTGGTGTSIQQYDAVANAWVNLANTNATTISNTNGAPGNTVADNKAFSVFVTGHYGSGNVPDASGATATTISATGQLQIGTQTFTYNGLAADRYVLVGNPYASPVDFTTVSKSNIKNGFWAWDPQRSGTSLGGYVTVSWDAVANDYDIDYLASQTAQSKVIQSGQAVLVQVQNGGSTSSVSFKETDKASAGTNTNLLFRGAGIASQLRVILNRMTANTATPIDGVLSKFAAGYSAQAGDDAAKLYNYDENFSLNRNGQKLSIERRPEIATNDTLFLNIASLKANTEYSFELQPSLFDNALLSAYLVDNYRGTQSAVSMSANNTVRFTVDANTASANADRFMIVFRPAATLPVTLTGVKAWLNNGDVQVQWNVAGETNIRSYMVERSANAVDFTSVNTTVARNQNKAEVYNFADVAPLQGVGFYRIRIVDNDGSVKYSTVVKVQVGKATPSFTIFPNPVKNKQANIQLANVAGGSYNLSVFNEQGQQVYRTQLTVNGSASAIAVKLPSVVSAGTYHFVISGTVDKSTFTQNVIVQ